MFLKSREKQQILKFEPQEPEHIWYICKIVNYNDWSFVEIKMCS